MASNEPLYVVDVCPFCHHRHESVYWDELEEEVLKCRDIPRMPFSVLESRLITCEETTGRVDIGV